MKPGDIVLVNFRGAIGIKRRPAVVISTADYGIVRPDVILAVVTTQIESADSQFDYLLRDWQEAGLRKPSAVRAYVGTYDQRLCSPIVGRVSNYDWKEIRAALRLAIAIDES